MPIARFSRSDDPTTVFEAADPVFLLGRSDDCQIAINDPHVSRIQARFRYENGRFHLENLGRNPIRVNQSESSDQVLQPGDVLQIGNTRLVFDIIHPDAEPAAAESTPESAKDRTVAAFSAPEAVSGPRLVLIREGHPGRFFPLGAEQVLIGRSREARIRLEDPSVSRRHGMIEKQQARFVLHNLSDINPVAVNQEKIDGPRPLYNGDQIRIGDLTLLFVSDRPEDDKKPPAGRSAGRPPKMEMHRIVVTAAIALVIGMVLMVWYATRPPGVEKTLADMHAALESGRIEPVRQGLEQLLKTGLEGQNYQNARQLLARAALMTAEDLERQGRLEEAAADLEDHLRTYGEGETTRRLWDHLDSLHLKMGLQQEKAGADPQALQSYASVSQNGPHARQAADGIRRIWLGLQQQQHRRQNLEELLEQANTYFQAKQFLTPVDQNAYACYQSVLAIEPDHPVALERIEQMKAFYSEHAERFYRQGQWQKALTYYERYRVIDPDNAAVADRIEAIRSRIAAKPRSSEMVQYLFQSKGGETLVTAPF